MERREHAGLQNRRLNDAAIHARRKAVAGAGEWSRETFTAARPGSSGPYPQRTACVKVHTTKVSRFRACVLLSRVRKVHRASHLPIDPERRGPRHGVFLHSRRRRRIRVSRWQVTAEIAMSTQQSTREAITDGVITAKVRGRWERIRSPPAMTFAWRRWPESSSSAASSGRTSYASKHCTLRSTSMACCESRIYWTCAALD